ncbi:MAG: 1-deoxy-D-xylulose-5-phosphate synthase [Clostridia bacterium]|nr:1-deoxy-D-xylulose-5-phosphate synthase [Clostridia bacterium]
MDGMYLENIKSPADVKALRREEIPELCEEIRQKLLQTVSVNGGHLASNLCVVELTVALHRVFSTPEDKIIFDVGHQSYVHKLLTGRYGQFDTLRRYGGISGFTRRCESDHDAFGAGHSSTSISAAAGIAAADKLHGRDNFTVAVVGDGAFTGGMIYEAINNCAGIDRLIIVLNDNDMSISPNVGGMSRYFSKFRSSTKYFRFKNGTKRAFSHIPLIGDPLIKGARAIKNWFKKRLLSQNYFEQFGLSYYGPVDGADEKHIEAVLREAMQDGSCSVVHVCTKKGKGYAPAEEHPDKFHGISGFDIATGEIKNGRAESFSARFGKIICDRAGKDERIAAITAAMPDGTGLCDFAAKYPQRFFDVGIAEQHALTFACGLAAEGMIPVFAVYSTFMQRAYDQLLHDAALQKLHIICMLDRAGLVGSDGATHHGIFDVSFASAIPGVEIYSPDTFVSLEECFDRALAASGPVIIRYPKDSDPDYGVKRFEGDCETGVYGEKDAPCAIITYGRMTKNALGAADLLEAGGIKTKVMRLTKLAPLPEDKIIEFAESAEALLFLEEGIESGGIGERTGALLAERGVRTGYAVAAIKGGFPSHGKNEELWEEFGISASKAAKALETLYRGKENAT